ncbi:MAG: TIGR04376 family protein [Cyanobacteria bacterium P01_G01_bin.54]
MGLFDELSQYLEQQLDAFLKQHPHLELQALDEQLQEQSVKTEQLIHASKVKEQQLQQEVLALAAEIKRWHQRIAKAERAGRIDLLKPAREREAALLRQGNQVWGRLAGVKQHLEQAQSLLQQTQARRREVQRKMDEIPHSATTTGWEQSAAYGASPEPLDPVEARFRKWELEQELEQLKRDRA